MRVQSEMGLNRNEEEVQVGHSFDIRFKMKIVNDKIIWNDESDKRKGYNLKDGRNIFKTGLVNEVTAKAGLGWIKKAMNKLNTQGLESNHCLNLISDSGVVSNYFGF